MRRNFDLSFVPFPLKLSFSRLQLGEKKSLEVPFGVLIYGQLKKITFDFTLTLKKKTFFSPLEITVLSMFIDSMIYDTFGKLRTKFEIQKKYVEEQLKILPCN